VDARAKGGVRARSRGWQLAIAIGMLAAVLLSPAAAGATRTEFYGIVQTATLDNQDIQGMLSARVRTTRFVLKWGWVQPVKGSYRWKSSDDFIGALAARGIRSVPSVWGNPGWLPGSGSTPPLGGNASQNEWRALLRALVSRYGPGGAYWKGPYQNHYGQNAEPLPIQSWEIWNEPNLRKFFAPYPSPGKYAHLVQISRDAIRSKAPGAQIVLAGMPGYGDIDAWDFLRTFYAVRNIKNYFDAVALHPYGPNLNQFQSEIQSVRNVMRSNSDGSTPLWITEIAWGSAPPDAFGINKGLAGQAQILKRAFRLVLQHRTAWNIQRLFWYHWRDPKTSHAACSFCGSAGLLNFARSPKPALAAFKSFSAETSRPTATITGGPTNGKMTNNPTPTFKFTSSEPGSTFACSNGGALKDCGSPHKLAHLSDGTHVFYVRAIDAAGNDSRLAGRYFTVDTRAPATPKITSTSPASPADDNAPEVIGTAAAGMTIKIFKTAGCTGNAAAKGSTAKFKSTGITVPVPSNATTSLRAKATDPAGNSSLCSPAFTYVEDSTP
jgi:hypothetical protein